MPRQFQKVRTNLRPAIGGNNSVRVELFCIIFVSLLVKLTFRWAAVPVAAVDG